MSFLSGVESQMRAGRWEDARMAALLLLEDYPAHGTLLGYLGLCEFKLSRFPEALEPLQKAAALDPGNVDIGIKLAQTYDRLKRYHECAITAKLYLVRRPSDHTLQGLLEAHEGDLSLDLEGWEKNQYVPKTRRSLTNRS